MNGHRGRRQLCGVRVRSSTVYLDDAFGVMACEVGIVWPERHHGVESEQPSGLRLRRAFHIMASGRVICSRSCRAASELSCWSIYRCAGMGHRLPRAGEGRRAWLGGEPSLSKPGWALTTLGWLARSRGRFRHPATLGLRPGVRASGPRPPPSRQIASAEPGPPDCFRLPPKPQACRSARQPHLSANAPNIRTSPP